MSLLKLLPAAVRLAGKVLGIDAGKVADAIEGVPSEKRAELEAALREHDLELRRIGVEELRLALSESHTLLTSEDKFVRRARPASLYAATVLTSFLVGVVGVLMLRGQSVEWGSIAAIANLILPLWGHAAYYTHNRTKEKMNGGGA